jgi:hypothetical protein
VKRVFAAGVLLLAAIAGCTTRERLNPLDPHNSRTGGSIPGFNAVASDGVVELRWNPLLLTGVAGYRIQRWTTGAAPVLLGASDYGPETVVAADRAVLNDSTYVYRLIAHLATGDSAVSAPDSATPGPRRIVALGAEDAVVAGFSPDLRDELFAVGASSSYLDMELDRKAGTLWLVADFVTGGEIVRYLLNGTALEGSASLARPTDISVGGNRGIAWVASPDEQAVVAYAASFPQPTALGRVTGVGHPLVVEAGSLDPSVWIGNREGIVYRVRPTDLAILGSWNLGAPARAIAVDEAAGAAWIAVRTGPRFQDLYLISERDSSAVRVRTGLDNVADLAVDPATSALWISERSVPGAGAGSLARLSRDGSEEMRVGGVEPYGIDVDLKDGTCWVSDLRSNRILHVAKDGGVLRSSQTLPVPYAVRVQVP